MRVQDTYDLRILTVRCILKRILRGTCFTARVNTNMSVITCAASCQTSL